MPWVNTPDGGHFLPLRAVSQAQRLVRGPRMPLPPQGVAFAAAMSEGCSSNRTASWQAEVAKSPPPGPCRLLDLPPELRSRIWEHVVIDYEPLIIMERVKEGSKFEYHYVKQPPLAATCHSVQEETLPMYYAFNTFNLNIDEINWIRIVDGFDMLNRWFNEIVRENAKNLRNVEITVLKKGFPKAADYFPWISLFCGSLQTVPPTGAVQLYFEHPSCVRTANNHECVIVREHMSGLSEELEQAGRSLHDAGVVDPDVYAIQEAMHKHLKNVPGAYWPYIQQELQVAVSGKKWKLTTSDLSYV